MTIDIVPDLASSFSKIGLLEGLPPDELRRFQDRLRSVSCAAGEVLVREGVWTGTLFIVRTGVLSVDTALEGGERRSLARLVPGECFGEMSLLSGMPPSATVSALVDSELWVLEQADFVDLIGQLPRLGRNISALLSRRLARMNRGGRVGPSRLMFLHVHPKTPRELPEAIARAVSEHLGTPLLAVDLRSEGAWTDEEELPPLESVVGNRQVHARLERSQPPRILATSGSAITLELWESLRNWLGTQVSSLLFLLDGVGPAFDHAHLDAASTVSVLLWPEEDRHISNSQGDVALLTRLPAANTRASLHSASRSYGRRVIRVLAPGDPSAVGHIGWLARHLAGLKVGIALGAGGARGYAHVGLLRAVQGAGVPVDFIAGTSIGAMVAAAYAHGIELDLMVRRLEEVAEYMRRYTVPRSSLLSNRGLRRFFREVLFGDTHVEDLHIPLAVVAVDLLERREVVLESGRLRDALLASTALPGVYPPIRLGNRVLVDGGVLTPVPTSAVRDLGADVVVGVTLGTAPGQSQPSSKSTARTVVQPSPNILDVMLRSFDTMMMEINRRAGLDADVNVLIEVESMTLRDMGRGRHLVPAGEAACEQAWPQIAEVLPWLRQRTAQGMTREVPGAGK